MQAAVTVAMDRGSFRFFHLFCLSFGCFPEPCVRRLLIRNSSFSRMSSKKGGKKAAVGKGKKRASPAKDGDDHKAKDGEHEARRPTDTRRIVERRVIPHLVVDGAEEALAWYAKTFGGEVKRTDKFADGRVMHSELAVFGSTIFVVDDFPEWHEGKKHAPAAHGGTPVTLHHNVDDVDAVFARAQAAGATAVMPPKDQFWGDRYGHLLDPFGHSWAFATPLAGGPADWPERKIPEPPTAHPPAKKGKKAAAPKKKAAAKK